MLPRYYKLPSRSNHLKNIKKTFNLNENYCTEIRDKNLLLHVQSDKQL